LRRLDVGDGYQLLVEVERKPRVKDGQTEQGRNDAAGLVDTEETGDAR
jgi:hypothetical protein